MPGEMDSGLWHHQQLRGQPLKKIVVLIPGPSWREYFWILNTQPEVRQASLESMCEEA